MSELHKPKVAILMSGEGTTAEAFISATLTGKVNAEVPLVISDEGGYPRAFKRVTVLNRQHWLLDIEKKRVPNDLRQGRGERLLKGHMTTAAIEEILQALEKHDIGHVALMGFMGIIDGDLIKEYGYLPEYGDKIHKARMSNTHRGPLPLTANAHGPKIEQIILASGRKTSEHTVHLVSSGIDTGPVLARHRFKIEPGWTEAQLFEKGQAVEKTNLPNDIDMFLQQQTVYYGHPEAFDDDS